MKNTNDVLKKIVKKIDNLINKAEKKIAEHEKSEIDMDDPETREHYKFQVGLSTGLDEAKRLAQQYIKEEK